MPPLNAITLNASPAKTIAKKKGSFAADVLKLASGTTSVQVLNSLSYPLLARLFAPEAFGAAALFASLTAIIGVVMSLRYSLSIIVAETDEDAANSMAVSSYLVLLITLITIPVIWFGSGFFLRWLHAPELASYLWLLPVSIFFTGLTEVTSNWNARQRQFGRVTLAQYTFSVSSVGLKVGAGLAGFRTGGTLIGAGVIGTAVSALILILQTWRDSSLLFLRSISWQKMKFVLKRYNRFPKYSTAGALINALSWQAPTFVLAAFFSPGVVGQYYFGNRLLRAPMNLVGQSISRVFFQRAAEARFQGTLGQSVENAFRYLVALSMFPSLLLALIGRDIFVVAFGQRWAEAGVYTQIMSLWMPIWFISGPLATVFSVLEEQGLELRLQSLLFATRIGSFVLGGIWQSPRLAVLLFSASGILVNGYSAVIILRKCGVRPAKMTGILFSKFLGFVPAGLLVGTLKYFGVRPLLIVIVAVVLAGLYFLNFTRKDPLARRMLSGFLAKVSP